MMTFIRWGRLLGSHDVGIVGSTGEGAASSGTAQHSFRVKPAMRLKGVKDEGEGNVVRYSIRSVGSVPADGHVPDVAALGDELRIQCGVLARLPAKLKVASFNPPFLA
jgi:hypothetical protein